MFTHEHHSKHRDSHKSPQKPSHRHSHKSPHHKRKKSIQHSHSKSIEKQQYSPDRRQQRGGPHSKHHHDKRREHKSRDYERQPAMQPPVQTEEEKSRQEARKQRFNQPVGKESNFEKQISFKQEQNQEPARAMQEELSEQQPQLAPRINLLAQPLTLQNFQQIAPLPKIQRPYQVSRQMRGNTKQCSKEDLDNDLDDYFNFSKDNTNDNQNQNTSAMESQYNNFYFNQQQQQQQQMQQYLQKQLYSERQKLSTDPVQFYQNQQPLMTVKQLQEQQAREQQQQQQHSQPSQQPEQKQSEKPQESYNSWVEWNDDQEDDATTQLSCPGLPGHFKIRLPADLPAENSEIKFRIRKCNKLPSTNEAYGSNDKLNDQKNKITQYADIWERQIKFLISDFELIDIFRKDEIAMKRYNRSIINYSHGKEKLNPIFSRAYFKLWETISTNKLLLKYFNKPMQIANLAEGPGGFIHCLVDYRNQQHKHPVRGWKHDEYYSITLKIKDKSQQSLDWEYFKSKKYFSMLDQQGYKVRLSYGASQDGDMLNTQNLRFFINYDLKDKKTNELKKCDLVTADGGIECSTNEEYAYQELLNIKLFFSEMITALAIQRIGGTYIMKIYDCFYTVTIEILVILAKYYQKVWITKPYTSRPASSERYLICENFQGIEADQIEKLMEILEEWVEVENTMDYINSEEFVESFLEFDERQLSKFKENLIKSNEDCVDSQMRKIEQGLKLIEKHQNTNNDRISIPQDDIFEVKKTQLEKALLWCRLHKVPHHENLELNN